MRAACAAMAASALLLATPAAGEPRIDYMLHCQGCHGPTGAGVPGNVPSFRDQVAQFLTVPGGREYLLRVPGTSQSELSDGDTARLMNWLLREFDAVHLPENVAPYTEEEVARLRRPALTDVVAVRARLVRAIQAAAAAPVR